ncbi:MAG TPA: S8 family serine peptidase [Tepidisphaeraceae bacterium]|jgi:subtilisin family serine protease|nr:S8 family serine peptidase [Tepidisphaeraceae bacterium]
MNGLSSRPQPTSCAIESLEARRLLAMNWGPYPQLIDQDKAVADFPNITGKGVNIAIIDSGIDFNHPKLQGKIWTNPGEIAHDGKDNDGDGLIDNTNGWDYYRGDNFPNDENSHGTQMAGIIAAWPFRGLDGFDYQGIAPDAKVIPFKVADPTGSQYDIGFCQRIERALRWIEANHERYNISIVNMSIRVKEADFRKTFADEVRRLNQAGVLMIASAGHYGNSTQLEWPAADPNVYSAGMVNERDQIPPEEQRGPELDILGPGSNIPILHKGSSYLISGEATSYPTPFIAGAAALVKQIMPNATGAQIMDVLKDSGMPIHDPGGLTYPRIDLDDAIRLAIKRHGSPDPDPDPDPDPTPTPTKKQTPFKGSPFNINSRIEAENFDNGGEGISFHDTSHRKRKLYRSTPVELRASKDTGAGYYVDLTRRGEWLEYTVRITAAGKYNLQSRVQSAGSGGSFHVEFDGADKTGAINIADSGRQARWKTITTRGLSLAAGRHVMRVFFDSVTSKRIAGHFNWFKLIKT